MARGVPVQPEQRARAIALIKSGTGRNAIARELGISTAAVSRIATDADLSFENTQAAVATTARKFDRAAARADIIDRLYIRSQKVLTRLEADTYVYYIANARGGTERVEDSEPPALDEKNLSAALGMYLANATKLELIDDADGLSKVESMLGRLAERFGLVDQ